MATDFTYGNKTINSSGPIKPSGKNQPLDPRTEVKLYADIESIPNPYIGMKITVLEDETNSGKMTDYKVLSLKADNLGVANSVVDRVQRYVDYLGVSSSGSVSQEDINTAVNNYLTEHPVSSGATAEQAAQIEANRTAIGDSNSGLTKEINDINDALTRVDAITLNGKKFSDPMTKEEYDSIVDKDENTIYLVDDNNVITGIPDYSTADANKVLAVNSTGTALAWINAPTGGGTGLTTEQIAQIQANKTAIGDENSGLIKEVNDIKNTELQNLNTAILGVNETLGDKTGLPSGDANVIASINRIDSKPSGTVTNEQISTAVNNYLTEHPVQSGATTEQAAQIEANRNAINDRYTKAEVDERISNISIESGNIKIRDVVNGESFIMILPIYGDIIVSSENISAEENTTTKFTVKLSKKPTNNQVVALSVSNSNCSIDKSSLTFTPTNYDQLQEINVTCNHDANSYRDKNSIITLSSLNTDSVTVNVTITNIDEQVHGEIVTGAVFDQANIKQRTNITSTYGFSQETITNMVNKETNSLDGGSSYTIFAKVGFEQKTGSENPAVKMIDLLDADNNNIRSGVFERSWQGALNWHFFNTKNSQQPNYSKIVTCENGVDMYITFVYDSETKEMYIYKDADIVAQTIIPALSGFNSENNIVIVDANAVSPIRRLLVYSKALTKEEILQNINALGGI